MLEISDDFFIALRQRRFRTAVECSTSVGDMLEADQAERRSLFQRTDAASSLAELSGEYIKQRNEEGSEVAVMRIYELLMSGVEEVVPLLEVETRNERFTQGLQTSLVHSNTGLSEAAGTLLNLVSMKGLSTGALRGLVGFGCRRGASTLLLRFVERAGTSEAHLECLGGAFKGMDPVTLINHCFDKVLVEGITKLVSGNPETSEYLIGEALLGTIGKLAGDDKGLRRFVESPMLSCIMQTIRRRRTVQLGDCGPQQRIERSLHSALNDEKISKKNPFYGSSVEARLMRLMGSVGVLPAVESIYDFINGSSVCGMAILLRSFNDGKLLSKFQSDSESLGLTLCVDPLAFVVGEDDFMEIIRAAVIAEWASERSEFQLDELANSIREAIGTSQWGEISISASKELVRLACPIEFSTRQALRRAVSEGLEQLGMYKSEKICERLVAILLLQVHFINCATRVLEKARRKFINDDVRVRRLITLEVIDPAVSAVSKLTANRHRNLFLKGIIPHLKLLKLASEPSTESSEDDIDIGITATLPLKPSPNSVSPQYGLTLCLKFFGVEKSDDDISDKILCSQRVAGGVTKFIDWIIRWKPIKEENVNQEIIFAPHSLPFMMKSMLESGTRSDNCFDAQEVKRTGQVLREPLIEWISSLAEIVDLNLGKNNETWSQAAIEVSEGWSSIIFETVRPKDGWKELCRTALFDALVLGSNEVCKGSIDAPRILEFLLLTMIQCSRFQWKRHPLQRHRSYLLKDSISLVRCLEDGQGSDVHLAYAICLNTFMLQPIDDPFTRLPPLCDIDWAFHWQQSSVNIFSLNPRKVSLTINDMVKENPICLALDTQPNGQGRIPVDMGSFSSSRESYDLRILLPLISVQIRACRVFVGERLRVSVATELRKRKCIRIRYDEHVKYREDFIKQQRERGDRNSRYAEANISGSWSQALSTEIFIKGISRMKDRDDSSQFEYKEEMPAWMRPLDCEGDWMKQLQRNGALELILLGLSKTCPSIRCASASALADLCYLVTLGKLIREELVEIRTAEEAKPKPDTGVAKRRSPHGNQELRVSQWRTQMQFGIFLSRVAEELTIRSLRLTRPAQIDRLTVNLMLAILSCLQGAPQFARDRLTATRVFGPEALAKTMGTIWSLSPQDLRVGVLHTLGRGLRGSELVALDPNADIEYMTQSILSSIVLPLAGSVKLSQTEMLSVFEAVSGLWDNKLVSTRYSNLIKEYWTAVS